MTAATFLLLALAAVVAVADWIAVAAGARVAEYVLKPLTMVVLIAGGPRRSTRRATPPGARSWWASCSRWSATCC